MAILRRELQSKQEAERDTCYTTASHTAFLQRFLEACYKAQERLAESQAHSQAELRVLAEELVASKAPFV